MLTSCVQILVSAKRFQHIYLCACVNNMYIFIGSTYRATLVAFDGKERLSGEEAFAQIGGENTVAMLNALMGKTLTELQSEDAEALKHRKVAVTADEKERLVVEVAYGENKQKMRVTALMGMFIARLKKRIREETEGSSETWISVALPPNHKKHPSVERAYREACTIAGLDMAKLFVADAADCLVATYTRKLSGLNPAERGHLEVGLIPSALFLIDLLAATTLAVAALNTCVCHNYLQGKHVLLVDMGHTQTTAGTDTEKLCAVLISPICRPLKFYLYYAYSSVCHCSRSGGAGGRSGCCWRRHQREESVRAARRCSGCLSLRHAAV